MHGYTQAILERLLGSSKVSDSWVRNNGKRFSEWLYDQASTCGCGCGEKVYFDSSKHEISELIRKYEIGGRVNFMPYLPKHSNYVSPANYVPSNYEHQIIIGSLCGDGSLSFPYKNKPSNPRITWNMGNKEHAIHKLNKFNEFIGATYSEKTNPGFGKEWHTVKTKSHPMLIEYVKKYGERKKNLKVESGIFDELDEIGWAWLYGDDGHFCKSSGIAYIHTEGFCEDDNHSIKQSLNKFINSDSARVHSYIGGKNKRQLHCIRLTKEGTHEFIERVKKNMASGVEYKAGIGS
jgi:hypothetical protein